MRRRRARSPAGPGASSPHSVSNASPYSRRALRSSRDGSTRCGAPISDTCTWSAGCSRTSTPAAPAWSRWMWLSSRWRTSASASPSCGEPGLQRVDRRRRPAVEERRPVVGVEEVARRSSGRCPGGGGRSAPARHYLRGCLLFDGDCTLLHGGDPLAAATLRPGGRERSLAGGGPRGARGRRGGVPERGAVGRGTAAPRGRMRSPRGCEQRGGSGPSCASSRSDCRSGG